MKPHPGVILILEQYLDQAKKGEIQEILVWVNDEEGTYEYLVDDLENMFFELGSIICNERAFELELNRLPTKQ